MDKKKPTSRNGWAWVPTLYFAEGIPYIIAMTVSVIMYKRLGVSNTEIALYTSWLYLPWTLKPFWAPVVDLVKTKRMWIVIMQFFVGAGLAGVALTIPVPSFFQYTLAFFWLLAFSSATHDIAADGFYMLGLTKHDQAWFVGIRSTFYRLAMITGQGLLVILAGYVESSTGLPTRELEVKASPNQTAAVAFAPEEASFDLDARGQAILVSTKSIELATETVPTSLADSILAEAKAWNAKHHFYITEEERAAEAAAEEHSWWDEEIAGPISAWIGETFGPDEEIQVVSDRAGAVAVVFFRLAEKPSEEIVVNFGWESGDQSLTLIEGGRFTFNAKNWDKPAAAVVQADPKLRNVTNAAFEARSGNVKLSWIVTFFFLAGLFALFTAYHHYMLPHPTSDKPATRDKSKSMFADFFNTFAAFFKKERIGTVLAFLLLYRFAEAQIVKLATPFMLDTREVGGLALTTGEVGLVYGTVGLLMLTLGGILGGMAAAKHGLKYWIWWMAIAINLPDAVYVFLAYTMPDSLWTVILAVGVEQFGYGFGFTAYMLYQIYVSEGDHKTSHFAITTAFMALGMMIPGMFSGWLQELIGYQHFFVWICIATIPAFIVVKLTPIDPEFGKKTEKKAT
jgi:MFS transporter, PAT family, beta-lactamase induction signal transducer AmpG